MRIKPSSITSFALFVAALQSAEAACVSNAGPLPFRTSHTAPTYPPIDVNAPVGTVLATADITLSATRFRLSCTSAVGWIDQSFWGTPVGDIIASDIPGIGYRHTINTPSYYISSNNYDYEAGSRTVRVEVIKTGTIRYLGLLNIAYYLNTRSHINSSNPEGPNIFTIPFYTSATLRAEPRPTCSLSRNTIPVDFGVVPIASVNGQLAQRTVPIGISCSGGTPGASRPVYITLTDSNNVGNRGSNLTIVPNDSGMHINLRYANRLINFGPESSSAGNAGQFLLGNATTGGHRYDLTAHLMRNGSMRGLPSFSARATMTMRYE